MGPIGVIDHVLLRRVANIDGEGSIGVRFPRLCELFSN